MSKDVAILKHREELKDKVNAGDVKKKRKKPKKNTPKKRR